MNNNNIIHNTNNKKPNKWSMKDSDMRPVLFEHFESDSVPCRFFEELCIGKTRADAIFVKDDMIYGFELKSDCDNLDRLPRQINDYERFCDYMYVVCGSKLLDKVSDIIPPHWGIIHIESQSATSNSDNLDSYTESLQIHIIREATDSKKRYRLHNQLRLLWRHELIPFVKKYKLGGVSKRSKVKLVKLLEDNLTKDILKKELCNILINRDYSIYEETDKY